MIQLISKFNAFYFAISKTIIGVSNVQLDAWYIIKNLLINFLLI